MPVAFDYAARSDVGMVRTNNEDSGYAGPHLLAMADGMGGHAGGDVASSTIVGALVDLDGEALSGVETTDALLDRIHDANAELGERATAEPDLDGMGTTLIAILRAHDRLVLAHIGDSRAFLARDGEVTQITKDHSFVQQLVDQGRITPDEATHHPQRSLVTRVLTGAATDEPDITVRVGKVGDRYLIASDGLTDFVGRENIDEVLLRDTTPADCADTLVGLALKAGAPDNVTVVVGDLVDSAGHVPNDQPEVVGAAALRASGTRPLPVTPAAKAAALTQEATGGARDDELTLAEEGPGSRGGRLLRIVAGAVLVAVVLAGGGYAAYAWTQQQYYVGVRDSRVAVFRGVDQSVGPLSLSSPVRVTDIPVSDLPDFYRASLQQGIVVDSAGAADSRVSLLEVQAAACRWSRSRGQACASVPQDWTAPSPSPSGSASASPKASPSPSSSAHPTTPTLSP